MTIKLSQMMNNSKRSSFQFGHIYSDSDIIQEDIKAQKYRRAIQLYTPLFEKVNSKIKDFITDFPKLLPAEKAAYKKYKAEISSANRELIPIEHNIKYMRLSQEPQRKPVTAVDIVDYSREKDITPSEAVDLFDKNFPEYAYHPYIETMAKYLQTQYRTFKFADEPAWEKSSTDRKLYWLDEAVKIEDSKWQGKDSLIANEVKEARKRYELIRKEVKSNETSFVIDTVKDHIGRQTSKFTPAAIQAITSKQEIEAGVFAGEFYDRDINKIRNACDKAFKNNLLAEYEIYRAMKDDYDGQMGGFFKSLFGVVAKVLSPFEKFMISPFRRIIDSAVSPVIKKIIPSSLYDALSGLSQASAQILSGKISKENIRKAVKSAMTIGTGITKYSPLGLAKKGLEYGDKLSPLRNTTFHKTITNSIKGVIGSTERLQQVPVNVVSGNKIDVKQTIGDAVVVGGTAIAIMTGGAGAVAIPMLVSATSAQVGADKTTIGRGLTTTVSVAAGGGGIADAAKAIAAQEASRELAQQTGNELVGIVGNVGINSALSSSQTPFAESFGTGVKSELTNYAVQKVQEKVGVNIPFAKYGEYLDMLDKVQNFDLSKFDVSKLNLPNTTDLTKVNLTTDVDLSKLSDVDLSKLGFTEFQIGKLRSFDMPDIDISLSLPDVADVKNEISKMDAPDAEDLGNIAREQVIGDMANKLLEYDDIMTGLEQAFKNAYQSLLISGFQKDIDQLLKNIQKDIYAQFKLYTKDLLKIKTDYFKSLDLLKNIKDFDVNALIAKLKNLFNLDMKIKLDEFLVKWFSQIFDLLKKYGPELLKYLMYMFGPKPEYKNYKATAYKTWKAPTNGRLLQDKYHSDSMIPNLLWIAAAGLGGYYVLTS